MFRFSKKCSCHIQTQVFNALAEGNVLQGQSWNDLGSLIGKIIHI